MLNHNNILFIGLFVDTFMMSPIKNVTCIAPTVHQLSLSKWKSRKTVALPKCCCFTFYNLTVLYHGISAEMMLFYILQPHCPTSGHSCRNNVVLHSTTSLSYIRALLPKRCCFTLHNPTALHWGISGTSVAPISQRRSVVMLLPTVRNWKILEANSLLGYSAV
jgi:hypothetical protein